MGGKMAGFCGRTAKPKTHRRSQTRIVTFSPLILTVDGLFIWASSILKCRLFHRPRSRPLAQRSYEPSAGVRIAARSRLAQNDNRRRNGGGEAASRRRWKTTSSLFRLISCAAAYSFFSSCSTAQTIGRWLTPVLHINTSYRLGSSEVTGNVR